MTIETEVAELRGMVIAQRDDLNAMKLGSPTFREALLSGTLVTDITSSAARTDTAGVADGEVHLYRSGVRIILQIFDFTAGAWRAVILA